MKHDGRREVLVILCLLTVLFCGAVLGWANAAHPAHNVMFWLGGAMWSILLVLSWATLAFLADPTSFKE